MALKPKIEPVDEHFLVREYLQRFPDVVLAAPHVLQFDRFTLVQHGGLHVPDFN
jgi:hypothetical protein